jgi:hypothetical protein
MPFKEWTNIRRRTTSALKWLVPIGLLFLTVGCVAPLQPQAASSGYWLEYHRTGGFAGVDELLQINEDGTARVTRRGTTSEIRVDQAKMKELQQALDDAQFTTLNSRYMPAQAGADLFEYSITYAGHTVQTADTAVPAVLQPVIQILNTIVSQAG